MLKVELSQTALWPHAHLQVDRDGTGGMYSFQAGA